MVFGLWNNPRPVKGTFSIAQYNYINSDGQLDMPSKTQSNMLLGSGMYL